MKIKEYKSVICAVEGCTKKVHANGLCSKHNNNRVRSGDLAGVYKIALKDKIYNGMSLRGVNDRVLTERSRLIKNNPQSVSRELLEYFNELCHEEPHLSRKEIADRYFGYEIIESSTRWIVVNECFNDIDFKDKKEQMDLTFGANVSTNPEIQKRKKWMDYMWKCKESKWIRYYKNLDKQNGTHNCLNIRD